MLQIEHEESLVNALRTGVNLFLGAGFSTMAKDSKGQHLCTGDQLSTELIAEFNAPAITPLDRLCTFIESTRKDDLRRFLIGRFRVEHIHPAYQGLFHLNVKRIYTTNIDNLIPKLYSESSKYYVSDVTVNGANTSDENGIEYLPIHGCVDHVDPRFVFSAGELASSFHAQRNAWESLRAGITKRPTLFLGFGFNDAAVVQALYSADATAPSQRNKWILLRSSTPEDQAYFKAIGFNVISGSVKEMLEYFTQLHQPVDASASTRLVEVERLFKKAAVPKTTSGLNIRPIEDFFLGDAPVWSDIFNNRLPKTHHFGDIMNLIHGGRNVIVTGIPGSGKSTLMMQLASELERSNKLLFDSMTINKAKLLCSVLQNNRATIFIDNFTDDMESFMYLSKHPNVQVIGFDRHFNLEVTIHIVHGADFVFHDVTELTEFDNQLIYDKIPLGIRSNHLRPAKVGESYGLFEFVNYNLNKPGLAERYGEALKKLELVNPVLQQILVLCCYVHSCRVPVSFDLVNAYLDDLVDSYEAVQEKLDQLKGLVTEYVGPIVDNLNSEEEYYTPRSAILAETILEQTSRAAFERVFIRFHDRVPQHLIPNYHVFKRRAYDAMFVHKAFPQWRDGKMFYEERYDLDRTPFLLQQCAIYLMQKKRHEDAAYMIDRAVQVSKKRIFTIENTHAIIMFQANIEKFQDDVRVREVLDRSMRILEDCYTGDQRKSYHIAAYARQAVQYYDRFGDEKAKKYLESAQQILAKEVQARSWNRTLREVLSAVRKRL